MWSFLGESISIVYDLEYCRLVVFLELNCKCGSLSHQDLESPKTWYKMHTVSLFQSTEMHFILHTKSNGVVRIKKDGYLLCDTKIADRKLTKDLENYLSGSRA